MAFNYSELTRIKQSISNDAEELNEILKDLNNLIEDNVGNISTWSSSKADEFKQKWNDFSTEKFPVFEKSFKSQVNVLDTAIKSYQQAEQK